MTSEEHMADTTLETRPIMKRFAKHFLHAATNASVIAISVTALGLVLASCGGSEEGSGTETASTGTSGGETPTTTLERPPGTVEPDEWDEEEVGEPVVAETPTETGTETGASEGPSPWGATRAEQCRRPDRQPMSGSAQSSFDQGTREAGAGNIDAARAAFQSALASDRNAFKAAYNLGVLADRAGRENQALEFYRQALRIQPDYERAAEGVITIHVRRRSPGDALSFISPLARANPTNLELQALYAEVLVRMQRYEDAFAAARRALRCDERHVPSLTALVKASLAQGRTELAKTILDQALSIDDNDAQLHFIKGTMLREQPNGLRLAMEEFSRAVQLRPDYAEARMALGIQQLAGGNYTEAVQNFEAAQRLAPSLVPVHLNLAEAYRSTKQWEKAKSTYDRALGMDGNLAQAHYGLALMYMSAGEEYPGLDDLTSLQKASEEFRRYRDLMGPRLPREDPSVQYLTDLERQIKRVTRRRERDAERAEREAREAAEGGGDGGDGDGGDGGGDDDAAAGGDEEGGAE